MLRKKDNTPGGLAAELDDAAQNRDSQVAWAERLIDSTHVAFGEARRDIIDRGIERVRQIKALMDELDTERVELETVINSK